MSSHRRVPARKRRLRLMVTGAAALAVLGGGTAFACAGVGAQDGPVTLSGTAGTS
ncbi:hypothetical protein P3T37_007197 [Kitasatospora sp. MAA4]|uniref:hypothetical protein n=1 Tax=Kitasatospora sp. MAA4 TaxID=3035093 RepID=UPI002476B28B|nr:hypothetical protein [Kitasatospora sp. MAA4]MDH6137764.1 hypothetical protein [Kitasatospora sp. MAA4]